MALLNGENVYKRIRQNFQRADEIYNSGLFHFKDEKGRAEPPDTLSLTLNIDDKPLKDILKNLYYPESPYEFSVLPADILGQVYEQFLGKVIRLTAGHQAKVEDKPEVKKAGGVFYTPTYIVDYIVKNTVGKLIENKTPKQIEKLKILDPACGSGSFLIQLYQFLLDYIRDWYINDGAEKYTKGKEPKLTKVLSGEWRLSTPERKKILLDNIHGVDIDSQAVEVTKLSLLLKVLEGENEQSLAQQMTLWHQRALPDLENNIKCGNSLIGTDYFACQGVQEVMALYENNEDAERIKINAFDWDEKGGFPEIMKNGGFDAVIGNPPYVIIAKDFFSENSIDYLKRYPVAQYKTDLFHLFIQKGIDLLNPCGLMGFITPNTWYTLQFTSQLREYVLNKSAIEEIVVFNHKVFGNADVDTGLLFLSRKNIADNHNLIIKNISSENAELNLYENKGYKILQKSWLKNQDFRFEVRQFGKEGKLVKRLVTTFPPLINIARASLGCQAYNSSKHAKQEIKDRIFHSSKKLSKDYLPELAGNDVGRYFIERKKGEWIKYGPWLHDYRTMDWLTGPRILILEIAGKMPYKICSSYTEENYC
ncbi:MAG: N-6 DNA methylase, partial [Chitinivibrionales bacterium]|nr:N-6 DNA methylase [Chitinivibrionales bacterium]